VRRLTPLAVLALALAACNSPMNTYELPDWSYEGDAGPEHWGDLTPDWVVAKRGERQSPIDVRTETAESAVLDPIQVDYQPCGLRLANDGLVVALAWEPKSRMTIGSQRYELVEVRFHAPAEHTVDSRRAPLEIQLWHRQASGRLAATAVLVTEGAENATLAQVIERLGAPGPAVVAEDVQVDAGGLLPADLSSWRYSGSQTTPPCREDVGWFVLQRSIEASPEQIAALRAAIGPNARPTQRLHGRRVIATP